MGLPGNIYKRVEGTRWRHVWVVGDIHGCFSMLVDKLRQCRFDPWQDLLVSVGDVIDPGFWNFTVRPVYMLLPMLITLTRIISGRKMLIYKVLFGVAKG